jgi:lipopolysaccharide biosynthesis glycosyltransferase
MELSNCDLNDLVVVVGADENYSLGLAVTVQSMMYHLNPQRRVQLYMLDGGILPTTKNKLLKSWNDPRLMVHWVDVDMHSLSHLVTAGHLNHTTYLRLLIPSILPADVKKVLYLDSDLLIREDIAKLWDIPFEGNSILAAPEISTPYVDSKIVFADAPSKYSKLGTTNPIVNYRDLGMDPFAKVFNAGILLIDLEHWRTADIPARAYECLEKHREHVLFCDQYALNVVLHHQWRELDARWNQNSHFYVYKQCEFSPLDEPTFNSLVADPWICHFTWIHKPWFKECKHPFASEFVQQLHRTQWSGHRLQANPALAELPLEVAPKQRTFKEWLLQRRDRLNKKLNAFGFGTSKTANNRQAA